MVAHYDATDITLHVRKSNRAAISLYRDTLGFEVHSMEKAYCALLSLSPTETPLTGKIDADGEDAYGMRLAFASRSD